MDIFSLFVKFDRKLHFLHFVHKENVCHDDVTLGPREFCNSRFSLKWPQINHLIKLQVLTLKSRGCDGKELLVFTKCFHIWVNYFFNKAGDKCYHDEVKLGQQ